MNRALVMILDTWTLTLSLLAGPPLQAAPPLQVVGRAIEDWPAWNIKFLIHHILPPFLSPLMWTIPTPTTHLPMIPILTTDRIPSLGVCISYTVGMVHCWGL